MGDYYDRSGTPMALGDWAEAMNKPRHVGDDTVNDQRISTVWLGLDHAYDGGPPKIFETMVFGGKYDQELRRYSTEADALAGHQFAVQALKDGRSPWPGDDDR